jgi:hypothetical protein
VHDCTTLLATVKPSIWLYDTGRDFKAFNGQTTLMVTVKPSIWLYDTGRDRKANEWSDDTVATVKQMTA